MPDFFPDLEINLATERGPLVAESISAEGLRWGPMSPRNERNSGAFFAPAPPADPEDFLDERVGYGVIVSESFDLTSQSAVVKKFFSERKAKVFRASQSTFDKVKCDTDTIAVSTDSPSGNGRDELPDFLLILGGPDEVTWQTQFSLQCSRAVGRLPIKADALDRYLDNVLNGWKAPPLIDETPTMAWSVDSGDSITQLMRSILAEPLQKSYINDNDLNHRDLTSNAHDGSGFLNALDHHRPHLIISTSHGRAPANQTVADRELGVPVDHAHKMLPLKSLHEESLAANSIWWCHACNSAGSLSHSAFTSLLQDPSHLGIRQSLQQIASLGNRVSPLPLVSLSAPNPIRNFIGQVEPTFNWTLQSQGTASIMSERIKEALYQQLFRGHSIGNCMTNVWTRIGELSNQYESLQANFELQQTSELRNELVRTRLAIRDVRSTVLFGDPAIKLVAKP